jgi:hypothetical protein
MTERFGDSEGIFLKSYPEHTLRKKSMSLKARRE